MPGAARVRLAAERVLRLRDLPVALTSADADVLLVVGDGCPGLDAAVDRLWRDMPAPRTLVRARTAEEVADALETARVRLADATAQRMAARLPVPPWERGEGSGSDVPHGGGAHGGNGHGGNGHGGGGHGGGGHGEHGGGHGADEMGMPAGLPMAEQGPDRDGLSLDRLHIPLGPLLADWPTGLTVRLTLQGDVVQQAEVDTAVLRHDAPGGDVRPHDAPRMSFWTEPWDRAAAGGQVAAGEAVRRRTAAHLDSLGRLLAVAGWPAAAVGARRLRDDLLAGAAPHKVRPRAARLARRVGRSRTLFWLTRGIGPLTAGEAAAAGFGGPAARSDGDVPARYRQWLAAVVDGVPRLEDRAPLDPAREESPRGFLDGARPPSAALVEVLPRLLEGAELAAARLVVASLDPDPDELAARWAEAGGG
jgi:hypothetical protein